MACFTGPLAGAAITAVIRHCMKKDTEERTDSIPMSEKLKWLEKMFLGGSALLAFEHIWHGEIIFSFPFLTAVKNGETMEMLKEIATVGSAMTGLILVVWLGMIAAANHILKQKTSAVKE